MGNNSSALCQEPVRFSTRIKCSIHSTTLRKYIKLTCLSSQNASEIRVVAGALDLRDTSNPVYNVVKIISHVYDE
jgi:hypothetical protein